MEIIVQEALGYFLISVNPFFTLHSSSRVSVRSLISFLHDQQEIDYFFFGAKLKLRSPPTLTRPDLTD